MPIDEHGGVDRTRALVVAAVRAGLGGGEGLVPAQLEVQVRRPGTVGVTDATDELTPDHQVAHRDVHVEQVRVDRGHVLVPGGAGAREVVLDHDDVAPLVAVVGRGHDDAVRDGVDGLTVVRTGRALTVPVLTTVIRANVGRVAPVLGVPVPVAIIGGGDGAGAEGVVEAVHAVGVNRIDTREEDHAPDEEQEGNDGSMHVEPPFCRPRNQDASAECQRIVAPEESRAPQGG